MTLLLDWLFARIFTHQPPVASNPVSDPCVFDEAARELVMPSQMLDGDQSPGAPCGSLQGRLASSCLLAQQLRTPKHAVTSIGTTVEVALDKLEFIDTD
jgi:hypothetical protein